MTPVRVDVDREVDHEAGRIHVKAVQKYHRACATMNDRIDRELPRNSSLRGSIPRGGNHLGYSGSLGGGAGSKKLEVTYSRVGD